MFNSSKFTLICVSCVAVMLLLWPTLLLACSSRAVVKPRPASIKSSGTTAKSSPHIRSTSTSGEFITPTKPTATATTTTTTKAVAAKRTVLPPDAATTTETLTSSSSTAVATTFVTTTTNRPNITFPTFKCPANYDAWYCLNEASCFTVKIGESIMYNCECANGFMGPRCEYKELDGSYQPKRPRPILEKAGVASGATCLLLFLMFVCLVFYMRCDLLKESSSAHNTNQEEEAATDTYRSCQCCGTPVYHSISNSSLSSRNEYIFKHSYEVGRERKSERSGSWIRKYKDIVKRFNKL